MRQVVLSFIFFAALLSRPNTLWEQEPNARAQPAPATANQRIKKVLFDSDRLWILALDGTLTALDLKDRGSAVVAPDKLVFDIYRDSRKQLYLLNIIVVSTDINWAKSLSGYTPLIAVRD